MSQHFQEAATLGRPSTLDVMRSDLKELRRRQVCLNVRRRKLHATQPGQWSIENRAIEVEQTELARSVDAVQKAISRIESR
jgi:hypothetical protein